MTNRSTKLSNRLNSVARILVSLPFALGARQVLSDPGPLPEFARRSSIPQPELATRVAATAMFVGAVCVASGKAPVAGGTLLAGTLVGTTVVVHGFWTETDDESRQLHRRAFIQNCGLLGGVILTAVHGHGVRTGREPIG